MNEEQNYYAIQELQNLVLTLQKRIHQTEDEIFNLKKEILGIQMQLELEEAKK